jgi:hypothetical protein
MENWTSSTELFLQKLHLVDKKLGSEVVIPTDRV